MVEQGTDNAVRQPDKAVLIHASDYAMATALLGGTNAMREASTKYMPRWPNETANSYSARLRVATLFPVFSHTIYVLSSKPFSRPITFESGSAGVLAEYMADVDMQGNDLDTFAHNLLVHALGYGLAGILVDTPDVPSGEDVTRMSKQRAEQLGLRPYMVLVHGANILGYRTDIVRGRPTLTMLRILETVTINDGAFGEKEIEQVRVLTPGAWELHRRNANTSAWERYKNGTTGKNFIPFVPVYGRYRGFMRGEPPLREVAYMNVKHWQSQSDQDTILHVARVPILATFGKDNKSVIEVGAASTVDLPKDGNMKFIEHTGSAIEAGQKSLDQLVEDMRQAGAEMLVLRTGQATATEIYSDSLSGMCVLQRTTINLQHSLNTALTYMAEYAGKAFTGKIKLFTDFGVQTLAQARGELLLKGAMSSKISDETLFKAWQREGLIDSTLTWEDEQQRLSEQGEPLGKIGLDDDDDPAAGAAGATGDE